MTNDEEKDAKLERDIINAVKARGLQESMGRWAKSKTKTNRRLKAIDIVLISVAAAALFLIVLNISIYHQSTDSNEEIQSKKRLIYSKKHISVEEGNATYDNSTVTVKDNGRNKVNIVLPNIVLNRYSHENFTETDSALLYLQNAEAYWKKKDLYRTKFYAEKAVNYLEHKHSCESRQVEMLENAKIYRILAIIYMQSPELSTNAIEELRRVSSLHCSESDKVKYVLMYIESQNNREL